MRNLLEHAVAGWLGMLAVGGLEAALGYFAAERHMYWTLIVLVPLLVPALVVLFRALLRVLISGLLLAGLAFLAGLAGPSLTNAATAALVILAVLVLVSIRYWRRPWVDPVDWSRVFALDLFGGEGGWRLRLGPHRHSSSSPVSSGSDSSDSTGGSGSERSGPWPWSGRIRIRGGDVEELGLFSSSSRVGHTEEHWGHDEIHREGWLGSSEKVGEVRRDYFTGAAKSIVDSKGREIGHIKDTLLGRKIIVDDHGNELGSYDEDE